MQARHALHAFPALTGLGSALQQFGAFSRTGQTFGIAWLDDVKQSLDDVSATAGQIAASRTMADVLAVQSAYLLRAGSRFAARSTAAGDLFVNLTGDLLRSPAAIRPHRAH
jgi:hypothetical protein